MDPEIPCVAGTANIANMANMSYPAPNAQLTLEPPGSVALLVVAAQELPAAQIRADM